MLGPPHFVSLLSIKLGKLKTSYQIFEFSHSEKKTPVVIMGSFEISQI